MIDNIVISNMGFLDRFKKKKEGQQQEATEGSSDRHAKRYTSDGKPVNQ